MTEDWKTFLHNAGAEFEDGCVANYGNLRRELSVAVTGNVFADLSHYGLIAVHGEDAETFMQGQFTNDIRKVDDQHSQLNGVCNPKGRLLASFRAFRHADSYYLCLPGSMIEELINRLRLFVLRSSVTLQDASDTFVHLGLSGGEAENVLADFAGTLPAEIGDVVAGDNRIILRVPGIHPSYELFTTTEQAATLWNQLNVHCAPVGAEAWQLLDILAGIPVIYPGSKEVFVPQMVNMQLIDGVSFKKGCYTGQEIVARMQYLGKLKKRMYPGRIAAKSPPRPGDALYSAAAPGQSCGQVVSAAQHPDGDYLMLAVLQIASADSGQSIYLEGNSENTLTIESLPYPFPSE